MSFILYHGTYYEAAMNICEHGILLDIGDVSVDFGRGFYTTSDMRQAIRWARRKALFKSSIPAIVSIKVDEDMLANNNLKVKRFDTPNLKWGQFIINNRNGLEYIAKIPKDMRENNLKQEYDICIGQTADGRVRAICDELLASGKTVNDLMVNNFRTAGYSDQYSFHTDKSIANLKDIRFNNIVNGRLQYEKKFG